MALGSTQPVTEMSTRNIFLRWAHNLTAFMCRMFRNLGSPTSCNRRVQGFLYLYLSTEGFNRVAVYCRVRAVGRYTAVHLWSYERVRRSAGCPL